MRFTLHATVLAVAALLASTGLAGCMTANADSGVATVYVKDAPTDDVAHLYVSFTKVEIHRMADREDKDDDDNETEDEADDDDGRDMKPVEGGTSNGTGRINISVREESDTDEKEDGKWITLFEGNATVDLRSLNGTARAFLGDGEVPVGKYNGIRIRVSSAVVELTNGTTANVKVPSGALRIVGHFEVAQDMETALTVDFDLEKSLIQRGNGEWLLKPVLRLDHERHERPHDEKRHERMRERDDMDEEMEKHVREHEKHDDH